MSSTKSTGLNFKDIIMELPKRKGYHRHHIVPKFMGGDDSADNLVYLTPEEHTQAHLERYKRYGDYRDAMAYNHLSKWNNSETISGYKQSPEHIGKRISAIDYEQVSKKLKERYKNQPHHTLGRKNGNPSEETKQKISQSTKGKKKDNSNGLMGGQRKLHDNGNYTCMCIGCRKPVSPSRLNRHKKCFKE
jgi:hypothetical protein